jgi:negative regulator of genetic competence, sporulation and motility
MLKPIVAIIFLLSFALQTFSAAVIVADYITNKASFAKNCENKAKPKMHCNGKCQMRKKLQQDEQKDQQNAEHKGENKYETILYLQTSFARITSLVQGQDNTFNIHNNNGKALKMPRTVFHPPGA